MSPGAKVRLSPPVVYVVPFVLTWALQQRRPWSIGGSEALGAAGLALMVGGIAVMLWSLVTMLRANTTVIPWEQVSAIVSTGPFCFSRNPIYLADAITYIGGSLLIHSWWPLLLLPGIVAMMARMVIDRQERYLTERFGEVYRRTGSASAAGSELTTSLHYTTDARRTLSGPPGVNTVQRVVRSVRLRRRRAPP